MRLLDSGNASLPEPNWGELCHILMARCGLAAWERCRSSIYTDVHTSGHICPKHCGHFQRPILCALTGVICRGRTWSSVSECRPGAEPCTVPSAVLQRSQPHLNALAVIPGVAIVAGNPKIPRPAEKSGVHLHKTIAIRAVML